MVLEPCYRGRQNLRASPTLYQHDHKGIVFKPYTTRVSMCENRTWKKIIKPAENISYSVFYSVQSVTGWRPFILRTANLICRVMHGNGDGGNTAVTAGKPR